MGWLEPRWHTGWGVPGHSAQGMTAVAEVGESWGVLGCSAQGYSGAAGQGRVQARGAQVAPCRAHLVGQPEPK